MNGHAVGLGLTLASQCDLRIAADEGPYGVLQVRCGVMPDACSSPFSVAGHAVTKRLLWQSSGPTLQQVEHFETQLHHHLMGGPDAIEGGLAYVERRAPRWKSTLSADWPVWPDDPDEDS
jgi:enoyl-CoA hydratase/carnithine racemase